MAKLFKIQTYYVDCNDRFADRTHLARYLENSANEGFVNHTHIEEADLGEWHDEHPLNYVYCPESEFEKYFKED